MAKEKKPSKKSKPPPPPPPPPPRLIREGVEIMSREKREKERDNG